MRLFRNVFLLTLPALAVTCIVLEFIFTFVIPAAEAPYYYFDVSDRILRFSTAHQREGLFTIGSLAQQRAKWRVNNAGWNYATDYLEPKDKLRIAVIGDSYVEALQVNVGEAIAGQLNRLVSAASQVPVDIYSFGISGASLSQYLQMARYVRAHFDPDIFIFNVVHNDFAESLCSVDQKSGMLCLEDRGQAIYEDPIRPYLPNPIHRMARRSSLVRFLVINLQIGHHLQRMLAGSGSSGEYNANIDAKTVKAQEAGIQRATEYVLETLKRESAGKLVLFIMDAPRRDIYSRTMNMSNVRWLNEMLKAKTEQFGFHFIDLTAEFTRVFESEHVRLESEYDWHWNEKGHQVAAREVYNKLLALHILALPQL